MGRGRRGGPRRIRLTPTRVTLLVALGGSGLFLLYTVLVRDASPPLLSSGAGVLGIVFAALAVAGGVNTYRAATDGRAGPAIAYAVGGGVAGIIAALCFALALVLAMVWQSVGTG